ncbi:unnamed protein product [Phaeothamnion confervicola]
MLPRPFIDALDNEACQIYRQNYQRFRAGDARGAVGEEPKAPNGAQLQQGISVVAEDDHDDWDAAGEDTSFGEIFRAIAAYRIDYRAHRRGAQKGAKGESSQLAHKMTMRHAMTLPVSQLVSLARFRAAAALEAVQSASHIHLGAGKLGLGLVVPAIHASGQPYAIVQRPSRSWSPLTEKGDAAATATAPDNGSSGGAPSNYGGTAAAAAADGTDADADADAGGLTKVGVRVNGNESIAGLVLVKDTKDILAAAEADCTRLFACTDDPAALRALVGRAQTFSVALGPAMANVVLPLCNDLPLRPRGERPCLYACENDHKAVDELTKKLEGRVDVVSCMVDRICTERSIGKGWVEVETEPYGGEIVVIAPPRGVTLPPFAGEGVKMPRLEAEAEYFCQRKIIMVNGMHTTLAFLTLLSKVTGAGKAEGESAHHGIVPVMPPLEHDLLTPDIASPEEQRVIWLWAVARLIFVMWEHEPSIIKAAHGVEKDEEACDILLAYAKATLARYGTVKDKCGRVLGGGVANRWHGRLKVIHDFLKGEPSMRGGIRRCLLERAGVKEADLRAAVADVVEKTQRFVGVTVKKQTFVSG